MVGLDNQAVPAPLWLKAILEKVSHPYPLPLKPSIDFDKVQESRDCNWDLLSRYGGMTRLIEGQREITTYHGSEFRPDPTQAYLGQSPQLQLLDEDIQRRDDIFGHPQAQ